jgi:hypothetical protein
MNPEFVRNTWLELSALRLWGLPLVVLAVAFVVNASGQDHAVNGINGDGLRSLGFGIFAVFAIWGGSKAAQSVTNEVIGATWDWQRLAQHRPWELLFGKLFGSTVFEWLGAACGLALFAFGASMKHAPGAIALDVLSLTLGALWLQSLALFASLASAGALRATRRPTSHRARQSTTLIILLVVTSWIGSGLSHILSGAEGAGREAVWWWTMPLPVFVALSLAMFIFWTLLGAHRLLRAELQEPVSPWPWIGCLLFLALYVFPLVSAEAVTKVMAPTTLFCGLLAVVCGALFYPLLLAERKDVVSVRSLAAAWDRGDGRNVWTRLPLWSFNLVGYGLSLAGLTASAVFRPSPELWTVIGVAASFGLFMLRDLGWILAVHLAPKPGRRPDLVVWFFLAVLYALVPMVLTTFGDKAMTALYLFVPGLPVVQAVKAMKVVAAPGLLPVLWAVPGLLAAWAFAWPRLARAIAHARP